jgi:hypothetical protein
MFESSHVLKSWIESKDLTDLSIECFTNVDILLKDKLNFFKLMNVKPDEINLFDVHIDLIYYS